MSLVKTDYGLVYNTDGSLCYTERTDDVPFQGVKSYAVEESTENLLKNNIGLDCSFNSYSLGNNATFSSQLGSGGYLGVSDEYSLYGKKSLKTIGGTGSNNRFYKPISIEANKQYFWSFYFKGSINYPRVEFYGGDYSWIHGHVNYDIYSLNNGWNRVIVKLKVPTSNTKAYLMIYMNYGQQAYFDGYQLEEKNFATSFINGSRNAVNNGYLKISLKNFNKRNGIISFWQKLTGHLNYGRLGYIIDKNGAGRFYWFTKSPGIYNVPDTHLRNYFYDENGDLVSFYDANVLPDNMMNNWVNYIYIFNENTFSVYIDGIKKIERSVSGYYGTWDYLRFLGYGDIGSYSSSYLISDLFIGEYKNKDGKVIWTDEYIKEVYEAKKPFSLPPKLPII